MTSRRRSPATGDVLAPQIPITTVTEALPLIEDRAVRSEARSFLEQEAQHASWHRQHVCALTRRWPGMVNVLSGVIACFDELTKTRSLAFRVAYIADVDSTFTSWFKMLLDNDRVLFGGGRRRPSENSRANRSPHYAHQCPSNHRRSTPEP